MPYCWSLLILCFNRTAKNINKSFYHPLTVVHFQFSVLIAQPTTNPASHFFIVLQFFTFLITQPTTIPTSHYITVSSYCCSLSILCFNRITNNNPRQSLLHCLTVVPFSQSHSQQQYPQVITSRSHLTVVHFRFSVFIGQRTAPPPSHFITLLLLFTFLIAHPTTIATSHYITVSSYCCPLSILCFNRAADSSTNYKPFHHCDLTTVAYSWGLPLYFVDLPWQWRE